MRAVIIPNDQAAKFRRILITWYKGIDAVELKDGSWFVSESDYKNLPDHIVVNDESGSSVKEELAKLPVRDLTLNDFQVAELETAAIKQ